MFISRSMTRKVVTVHPDATLAKAEALMQKKHIRHLPVVDAENRLVGIVTDRDLRSAMPSCLCTPEEGTSGLRRFQETRVGEVMTKNPATLSVAHTVQDALLLIQKLKVGALPVVDEAGRILGIVSVRDLLQSFITVMGIGEPGALLCVVVDNQRGQMKRIVDILTDEKVSIGSILVARHWDKEKRAVFPYVHTINVAGLKKRLTQEGFTLADPVSWYLENLARTPSRRKS